MATKSNKIFLIQIFLLLNVSLLPFNLCFAKDFSDTDKILSINTVNILIQAAECLSIKATQSEKNSYLSAQKKQKEFSHDIDAEEEIEQMDKYISMWEKDSDSIYQALKKHCPYTSSLIQEILDFSIYNESVHILGLLEDIIISITAAEILDDETQHKIYLYEHTPIGLDISPY